MAENPAEKAARAFRASEDALKDFISGPEVRPLFEEYSRMVEDYNERLDAAVRAVKGELRRSDSDKMIVEGIGAQKKYKRWYDAEVLAKLLPSEQADEILTEKIVYEVNESRLEQLCRQGEIDNNLVRRAYHEEEQNPSALPGTPKPYFIPPMPEG